MRRAVPVRDPESRFAVVWLSAFGVSLIGLIVLLVAAYGIDGFWDRLRHPAIDHDAYDILMATVAASVGVFLALFFSSVLALAAVDGRGTPPLSMLAVLGSWWVFAPFAYFCFTLELLLAAAWGFGRCASGLVVLLIAAVPVLYSLTRMARVGLATLER
jgi:hypothetical protein